MTSQVPNYFISARMGLDGLGCLVSGTIECSDNPGVTPFSAAVLLEVHSVATGWQAVASGFVENIAPTGVRSWQITVRGMSDLVKNDFWRGLLPPSIPGVSVSSHNLMSATLNYTPAFTDTETAVLTKLLEAAPDATWGVDAYNRVLLGRPSDGLPASVPFGALLERRAQGYETTPYVTHYRGASSDGRFLVEGGESRGMLVPRRAATINISGGEVTSKEVTSTHGPPVLAWKSLNLGELPDPNVPPDPDADPDAGISNVATAEVVATGVGMVVCAVLDVVGWRLSSVLVNPDQPNGYEPVNAFVSWGVELGAFPALGDGDGGGGGGGGYGGGGGGAGGAGNAVVFIDSAIWLSTSASIDSQTVGLPLDANPSPIHPEASSNTVTIFKKDSDAKTTNDVGKTFVVDFEIPSELFRQPQEDWAEKYGVTSRVYVHVAIGWNVIEGDTP